MEQDCLHQVNKSSSINWKKVEEIDAMSPHYGPILQMKTMALEKRNPAETEPTVYLLHLNDPVSHSILMTNTGSIRV